jgi:nitrogen PTS system EIIA component
MTKLSELLDEDRILLSQNVASKKRVLELLSVSVADTVPQLTSAEIFNCLINRERLGSTGLGHGVAIPHGRLKNVDRPVAAFLKLEVGIDYDAIDGQPVDLFYALLVPEQSTDEHLQILAMLAEMFSDHELCARLRAAKSKTEINTLLMNWQPDTRQVVSRAHR